MNVKDFSKEIKKDLKETNKNSTETITIRVTKDEKKRVKRLAKACKLSQTQLFKKLIQGADLKAIPPVEIYEISKELSAIREIILEYCLSGDSVRDEVLAIQRMMNTFFEHFGDRGSILSHHAYQSFKPGEVTPDLCHKIGIELAEKLWGDRYQVMVATHLNRSHLHDVFYKG